MTDFAYPPLRPPKGHKPEGDPAKPKFGRKGKSPKPPTPVGGKK